MGNLYVTNVTGAQISVNKLIINAENVNPVAQKLSSGSTANWAYTEFTAADFDDMILRISFGNSDYMIDLNRSHFFGDNDGAYPGADYDINFVLMGFNGNEISIMMVYRTSAGGAFNYCDDVKYMQRY